MKLNVGRDVLSRVIVGGSLDLASLLGNAGYEANNWAG